jgi:general secretion pathway protein D
MHAKLLSVICLALLAVAGCANTPEPTSPRPETPPTTPTNPSAEVVDLGQGQPAPTQRPPTVVQGTGNLIAPQAPAVGDAGATGDGYQLDFTDTEISQVVAAVLGDGLNVPYVVDPQVKGTMTLKATRPLTRDELLASLESALRVQNAALVDVNGVYHVVPLKDASRRITNLRIPNQGGRGYGIYVVPLQFVSAAEMQRILQPFAPEGGIVRVDEARNLLLLAGTRQEVDSLLSIVSTFDVDWLTGMSFAMYPLEYVDAKTMATELGEIFTGPRSPIAGVVRFVPITRLNSLMVITPQARYLQDVEQWIRRLDLGSTTPGRRIYVYDVQNGKADDLAASLSRILSIDLDLPSGGDDGTGSDEPRGPGTSPLAPSIPTPQRPPPGGDSSETALDSGALKIVPNEENNSLLILASPSEFTVIEAALKRLDVMPIQVLIEASIAEVTLTDEIRYGLQWSYQGGDGPLVLSEASSGTINPQFPGFSYLFNGRPDIRAVLNAIESFTNVRVLSSPKLMVLNNREAQLQIGDQVPITTQAAVSTLDPDSPIVNSVQFRDTGVILRVTPRANKSGRVLLEVAQEVSDVAETTSSGIDSPTIQQRKISSTVSVRDGDTIALGGLIRETRSRGGGGVPYLRKVPLFGELFGSTDKVMRRTELIVLLTPRVIRSDSETADAMEELRQQFQGLRRVVPDWVRPQASPEIPASAPPAPGVP